jgi:5-(carboxyamino)imidazole ribonucleotide mutase
VKVALMMGSDSDLDRLEPCLDMLRKLEIDFEARVLSAHRTPEAVAKFVADAPARGVRVFLCAAGGAAHLAGVVAAHTTLPVIGIPMDNPPLGGLDALLSTVQMPGGVPVAAVGAGAGGPVNAALLAARILGVSDAGVARRLAEYKKSQAEAVAKKDAKLQDKLSR